jgi:hypothetical protein
MRSTIIASVLVGILLASRADAVELTIVTPKGFVSFAAGDDWPVVGSQTKTPVAVMAFQVPDPADEGTPDSTNLAVSLFDAGSDQGRKAIAGIGRQYGQKPPTVLRVGEWKTFEQTAAQNGTEYTILDASRQVADVTVSVRLAWPHLAGHSKDHAHEMRQLFESTLRSVHGGLGPPKVDPKSVTRRQSPRPN